MKKVIQWFKRFFQNIWHFIDRKIVIPVTKIILLFTKQFDASGKRFEKWLSSSTTLLFVSLFAAVAVFIVVDQKVLLFSDNTAEVLKDRPVTFIYNEEAYVVEGLQNKVDVTLIGSRANLYFAKQSPEQEIIVDLSGLKPGTHKVSINYKKVLQSIDYKVNPSTITVNIYPKISETKTLTIDVLNQDALDSKLVIKSVDVDSDQVVIKGAEKDLNRVATVKALVDIKNLVKQEVGIITLKDVVLKAYDDRGNVVDVEIVPDKIDAKIEIASPSKELPIKIIPTGEVSFGLGISAIESSEQKVTVYGNEETLADLNFIPVEVDVTGLKENKQFKLEIPAIVGVKTMSVKNITVNISLDKATTREIADIGIESRNLADGYGVQGLSASDTKVTVVIKGVESVINSISPDNIKAYIDLNGLGLGEHEVEIIIVGSDSKVSYVAKTKKATIRIIKK